MRNQKFSNQSPKNKFRIQFNYEQHIEGIGHVSSYTTNDIEGIRDTPPYVDRANRGKATVTVYENKAKYPKFDWQVIKHFIEFPKWR